MTITELKSRPVAEPTPPTAPRRLPQGRLLVGVGLAVLVVSILAVGPLWALVLTLFALAIMSHVAGNAIGMRLRDEGSHAIGPGESQPQHAQWYHFAPTTPLSYKKRIGLSTLLLSGLSGIVGAILGGVLLARINGEAITVANLTLAVFSCGVLGGLWGFALAGFAKIFLHAWNAALKEE